MSKAYTESLVDEALNIANTVREEIGLDPVNELSCGFPGDGSHCAIARTISGDDDWIDVEVSARGISCHGSEEFVSIKNTPESAAFIRHFDAGFVPDLVCDEWEGELIYGKQIEPLLYARWTNEMNRVAGMGLVDENDRYRFQ